MQLLNWTKSSQVLLKSWCSEIYANEHIFEPSDLVQYTIRTQNLRNMVPLDIGYESELRAARQIAREHFVTGVTGHSGDPTKTGSLFFQPLVQ